ncbi:MAG: hypothetical protein WCT28_03285 [Patescibacteria group bacterium]|jgi:hypothetical protein
MKFRKKPTAIEEMMGFLVHAVNLLNIEDLPDEASDEAGLMLLRVLQWLPFQIEEDRRRNESAWNSSDLQHFLLPDETRSKQLGCAFKRVYDNRKGMFENTLGRMPNDIQSFFRQVIDATVT